MRDLQGGGGGVKTQASVKTALKQGALNRGTSVFELLAGNIDCVNGRRLSNSDLFFRAEHDSETGLFDKIEVRV